MSDPKTVLSGKVCLVTGASRTLGAEIARTMARYGAQVAVNYHRSEAEARALCAELTAQGFVAQPFRADVSDVEQATHLVTSVRETMGPLFALVNNVGPYVETPWLTLPIADFDRILAGNVRATFLLTQAAGGLMKAQGAGRIINIAATDAFHRTHSVYGLAKAGVLHLTEAMARELAPEVGCFAIAPDLIADNEDMTEAFTQSAIDATPLGRLVTRSEVAEMVCHLCTPAFDTLIGHTLVMDGGRSIPRLAVGPG